MIVVSGGLVLVAIILLVVGLIQGGLAFVYASIAVSVVAGIFLLLGALQRRGEVVLPSAAPGLTPEGDLLEAVTAVNVTRPVPAVESPGAVAVVPGRPRYHVESCRFLAGRTDVTTMPIAAARDEGYTACGVCKPDQVVAAMMAPETAPELVDEPVAEDLVLAEPIAAPRRKAPAKAAAAKPAAAKAAKPAAKAAAAPRTAATVVVIPDRDKFHTETCRFVRDVPGTMTVSKATAKRQGYTPCGVCKP